MKFLMPVLTILVSLTTALTASAKDRYQFRVESKFLVDGKIISSPTIVVIGGEKAEMRSSQVDSPNFSALNIVVEDTKNDDVVRLVFDYDYLNGERKAKGSMSLIVQLGKDAEIRTETEGAGSVAIQTKAVRLAKIPNEPAYQ